MDHHPGNRSRGMTSLLLVNVPSPFSGVALHEGRPPSRARVQVTGKATGRAAGPPCCRCLAATSPARERGASHPIRHDISMLATRFVAADAMAILARCMDAGADLLSAMHDDGVAGLSHCQRPCGPAVGEPPCATVAAACRPGRGWRAAMTAPSPAGARPHHNDRHR